MDVRSKVDALEPQVGRKEIACAESVSQDFILGCHLLPRWGGLILMS